jgi:hypothetical protein
MELIRETTRGRTSCVTAPLMSKSALISRNNTYVGPKSTDMVDKLVLYARRAIFVSPEVEFAECLSNNSNNFANRNFNLLGLEARSLPAKLVCYEQSNNSLS